MMETAFTGLLGCRLPIQLAAMGGGITTPELVIAVSRAGGLGMLQRGGTRPFAERIEEIDVSLDLPDLQSPLQADGSLVYKERPIELALSVGGAGGGWWCWERLACGRSGRSMGRCTRCPCAGVSRRATAGRSRWAMRSLLRRTRAAAHGRSRRSCRAGRAWHAGRSHYRGRDACNDFSIGIELEGMDATPYADAQYESLAALVAGLLDAYPTLSSEHIAGHSDIAPGRKSDPGPAFDWPRWRAALAARLATTTPKTLR